MHFFGAGGRRRGPELKSIGQPASRRLPDQERVGSRSQQNDCDNPKGAMRKRNGSDEPRYATGTCATSFSLIRPSSQNPRSPPELKSRALLSSVSRYPIDDPIGPSRGPVRPRAPDPIPIHPIARRFISQHLLRRGPPRITPAPVATFRDTPPARPSGS